VLKQTRNEFEDKIEALQQQIKKMNTDIAELGKELKSKMPPLRSKTGSSRNVMKRSLNWNLKLKDLSPYCKIKAKSPANLAKNLRI
jgi:predicted  nucleic acid-binding Zn-ribbon protein